MTQDPGESRDIAADWVTRIQQRDLDPNEVRQLTQWLNESDEHVEAFQRMTDLLDRTSALAGRRPATDATGVDSRAPSFSRTVIAAAAGLAAVAVVILLLPPDTGTTYATGVGQVRTLTLDDGSVVHLNAQSEIIVSMRKDARAVSMSSGEAVFDVSSDPDRPFRVSTDSADIQVTGTLFEVSNYDEAATVSVIEGSVRVRPAGGPLNQQVSIDVADDASAGRRVVVRAGDVGRVEPVDLDKIGAWRDGWIFHEGRPLQELVDRLNRQYPGTITVAGTMLAAERVSVAIHVTDDRDETLASLQGLLPITVETLAGDRVVLRARK
jgi:transmembrane sensor